MKMFYILIGTIFIIAGGLIYTLERGILVLLWVGKLNAHISTTFPGPLEPFTNPFILIFILIGIILFVYNHKKKK